jgi:Plasmid replication protein.
MGKQIKEETDKKEMKHRVFNIMQYCNHITTGEELITEDKIIEALEYKTIKRYAYVLHDKDIYSEEEVKKDKTKKVGDKKPTHYHIVLDCPNTIELSKIAKWFSVPPQFIALPKGRGAFLDCVQYLTHEREEQQAKGKHHYQDEEIKSDFDFRDELTERANRLKKYGRDLPYKERTRMDVMYYGKTLRECKEEDKYNYMNDKDTLKKHRGDYLLDQDVPHTRQNFYVYGGGGVGKGVMSRAIARSFYPDWEDEEIFFEIGGTGVSFDGYQGQPVLIWHDKRAGDLLKGLGGRGDVFNVFDTHPTSAMFNVKFGAVKLTNRINIVNSVDGYGKFLDELAGDYTYNGVEYKAEDKNQSYRRFPYIIPIRADGYDLLVNLKYFGKGNDYEDIRPLLTFEANVAKIAQTYAPNQTRFIEKTKELGKPIAEAVEELEPKETEEIIEEIEVKCKVLNPFADEEETKYIDVECEEVEQEQQYTVEAYIKSKSDKLYQDWKVEQYNANNK